jgi:hypothetical protein
MRFLPATLVLVAATAGTARADILSVYLQGHGGYGGGETSQLAPGGDEPSMGPALGLQLGARVLFLEGYVDRTSFHRGPVTRGILGLHTNLGLGSLDLRLRAGAGLISDEDGALDNAIMPTGMTRTGAVGRAGVALEGSVAPMLVLGLGLDGEYYVVRAEDDQVSTGSDVFGSAYLRFTFGI